MSAGMHYVVRGTFRLLTWWVAIRFDSISIWMVPSFFLFYYPLDWVDKSGRILDLTWITIILLLLLLLPPSLSLSLSIYGVCGNGGMIRLVGWMVGLASRDVNTICLLSRFFILYHTIGYFLSLIACSLACLLLILREEWQALICTVRVSLMARGDLEMDGKRRAKQLTTSHMGLVARVPIFT